MLGGPPLPSSLTAPTFWPGTCPSGKGAQSQSSHGHCFPLGSPWPGWAPDPMLTNGKGFFII